MTSSDSVAKTNLNPVEVIQSSTPETSAAKTSATSQSAIPLNIDEILRKLGITLEDYQAMSDDAKLQLIQEYNQQTANTDELPDGFKIERTTEDTTPSVGEDLTLVTEDAENTEDSENDIPNDPKSEVAEENTNENSEEHSITLPDNWDKMSVSKRQKFIKDLLGKELYGDEWDKKNFFQKNKLINNEFEKMIKAFEPQYDKYNNRDKAEALDKFTDALSYVLDNFDSKEEITSAKIFEALTEFNNKSHYEQYEAIQTVKQQENLEKKQFLEIYKGLQDYYGGKNITEISKKEKLEYLKNLEGRDDISDKVDVMISNLEQEIAYEEEIIEYYDGKPLSEITDEEKIQFLESKIKSTENPDQVSALKRKKEILERTINHVEGNTGFSFGMKNTHKVGLVLAEVLDSAIANTPESECPKTSSDIVGRTKHSETELRKYLRTCNVDLDNATNQQIYNELKKRVDGGGTILSGSATEEIYLQTKYLVEHGRGEDKFTLDGEISLLADLGDGAIEEYNDKKEATGYIDKNKDTNYKLLEQKLNSFEDEKAFFEWYYKLSSDDRKILNSMLVSKRLNVSQDLVDKLGLAKLGIEIQAATIVAKMQKPKETNTLIGTKALEHVTPKEGKAYITEASAIFDADELGYMGYVINNIGNSDYTETFNNAISEREDYNDIVKMVSYYQENAKATETNQKSSESNQKSSPEVSTSYEKETTTPISYTAPEINQPEIVDRADTVQSSEAAIEQLDLEQDADKQKLVEIISQDSTVLGKLDPQKKQAVLKAYCQQADGARLFELFKKNPSLYNELLNYAYAKINVYKDEMFKILISNADNGMEKYSRELDINLSTFAEHNREYAAKVAIETKDASLAGKIINNHALYGLQMGSSEHFELIRISNKNKKIGKEPPVRAQNEPPETPPKTLGLG